MVVQVEEAQKGCDEEVGQELIPAEQMEDCSKEMTLSVHALKEAKELTLLRCWELIETDSW